MARLLASVVTTLAVVLATGLIQPNAAHSVHHREAPTATDHTHTHSSLEHECVHESAAFQAAIARDIAAADAAVAAAQHKKQEAPAGRPFRAQQAAAAAAEPMRVVLRTLDVTTPSQYCTQEGDVRSDFQGGTATCTADDVLTAAKRELLLNRLLPAAIQRLASRIKVPRRSGALVVAPSACTYFTQAEADRTSGVPDADFVLYVAAAPISGGTIAWAGTCQLDSDPRRPIVGRANFDPSYLAAATAADLEALVDTAAHELLHALGVSSTFFAGRTQRVTRRGKTVTEVTTPKALAFARAFSGCASLTGVEIEDEGSSGSAGAHWERRLYKDELMTAAGGARLSALSLLFLEDLQVGYEVDTSTAEPMSYGAGLGCAFHERKCSDLAPGAGGEYFCFSTSGTSCTYDNVGIGPCESSVYDVALPSYYQYFADPKRGGILPYMDFCPFVRPYSNRVCTDASYQPSDTETVYGYVFAANSRCVPTDRIFIDERYLGESNGQRCLRVRCLELQSRVEVQAPGSAWTACPEDGSAGAVTVAGYRGQVYCPAASEICEAGLAFPAGDTTAVPTTSTTTTTPSPATPAPTPVVTLAPPTAAPPTTAAPPPAPTTTIAPVPTATEATASPAPPSATPSDAPSTTQVVFTTPTPVVTTAESTPAVATPSQTPAATPSPAPVPPTTAGATATTTGAAPPPIPATTPRFETTTTRAADAPTPATAAPTSPSPSSPPAPSEAVTPASTTAVPTTMRDDATTTTTLRETAAVTPTMPDGTPQTPFITNGPPTATGTATVMEPPLTKASAPPTTGVATRGSGDVIPSTTPARPTATMIAPVPPATVLSTSPLDPVPPPPTTTAASPTQTSTNGAGKLVISGTLRIGGQLFAGVLEAARPSLETALVDDLSRVTTIPRQDIAIDSLGLGSLIVNFTIAVDPSLATPELLALLLARLAVSAEWLRAVSELYGRLATPVNGTVDSLTVLSASLGSAVAAPPNPSGPQAVSEAGGDDSSSLCERTNCPAVFGGAVAGLVVLVGALAAVAALVRRRRAKRISSRSEDRPTRSTAHDPVPV